MLDSLLILGSFDPNLFLYSNFTTIKCVSEKYYAIMLDEMIINPKLNDKLKLVLPVKRKAIISMVSPFIEASRPLINQIIKSMSDNS